MSFLGLYRDPTVARSHRPRLADRRFGGCGKSGVPVLGRSAVRYFTHQAAHSTVAQPDRPPPDRNVGRSVRAARTSCC